MTINRSTMVPSASTYSTKTIKSAQSVVGFTTHSVASAAGSGAIAVNSGALTANVLSTVFSAAAIPVTMPHLTVRCADATARTLRVVVEVDGLTAFGFTSASTSAVNNGVTIAGWRDPAATSFALPPINSGSSLVVKVASNLTETDKFIIEYVYQELI